MTTTQNIVMNSPTFALLILLLFVCRLVCSSFDSVPFDVRDLHACKRVGNVASSKSGTIAYSVKVYNQILDKSRTYLKLYHPRSGAVTQLTDPQWGISDTNPVFDPTGNYVFFISDRVGDSSQVWYVAVTGNEKNVVQFTKLPVSVSNLRFSPNGDFIVFSANVYVDCTNLKCTAERDAQKLAHGTNTGYLYTSLFVRHWDAWETGKVSHLFRLNVQKQTTKDQSIVYSVSQNTEPLDLLAKANLNSPVPPFGATEQYDISPDGTQIAFTAEVVDATRAWSTSWAIYTCSSSGGGNLTKISWQYRARCQNPTYSPDGLTIAFLSMDRPGFEADRLHITLYDRKTNTATRIADQWDRSPSGIAWSPSQQWIFADADDDGHHKLFGIRINDSTVIEITRNGTCTTPLHNAGIQQNAFITMCNWFHKPDDIYLFSFSKERVSSLIQITQENPQLTKFTLSEPESFYFAGYNNSLVQGWLFKPLGWQPETKRSWPVAFLIHGGPQGAWTNDWSYRWNPQLWAARGYAVVMINPHGSTGFGQAFTDEVSGDWGGAPFTDLMRGLDYILANNAWMDRNRICACGASYGGYMINWIHGHTKRFRCLVNHDGVFDTRFAYYSTDELWFPEWEFKGVPWQNPVLYQKWNPQNYVGNWSTPTLVIHGGKDYRLPITEGIATFTALQRRGIPSMLLYFPEENHWVLNARNSIMWYDTVLGWLDRWTKM
jgi:dipeptidyl aminopeptidase/acylaminoacyl peptidase